MNEQEQLASKIYAIHQEALGIPHNWDSLNPALREAWIQTAQYILSISVNFRISFFRNQVAQTSWDIEPKSKWIPGRDLFEEYKAASNKDEWVKLNLPNDPYEQFENDLTPDEWKCLYNNQWLEG